MGDNQFPGAIVESQFEYKGYQCAVLMQIHGFRTGYVALPKSNRYYEKKYMDIPVECHWGLTYGRPYLYGMDITNVWWIGFDTAHLDDGIDLYEAARLFKDYPEALKEIDRFAEEAIRYNFYEGTAKSLEYCEDQCRYIVDQLIELEN